MQGPRVQAVLHIRHAQRPAGHSGRLVRPGQDQGPVVELRAGEAGARGWGRERGGSVDAGPGQGGSARNFLALSSRGLKTLLCDFFFSVFFYLFVSYKIFEELCLCSYF